MTKTEETNTEETSIDNGNKYVELRDNSKRAKDVVLVFWIVIGVTIVGIISGYYEIQILKDAVDGIYITDQEATSNDDRQAIIGVIQTVLSIISIIFFLNWFRRAYWNLHQFPNSRLKYSESASLWGWFIPILSLFRPYQIMKEIWGQTQMAIKRLKPSYSRNEDTFVIGLWWTFYIISGVIGRYVLKSSFKADTLEDILSSSEGMVILDLLQIPEALLVIWIVKQISQAETRLMEAITRTSQTTEKSTRTILVD